MEEEREEEELEVDIGIEEGEDCWRARCCL